jgi:hypothetical protein
MAYDRPMFATLHGGYPALDPGEANDGALGPLIERVIDAQLEAGLGLLTDGGVRWPDPGAAFMSALGGPERPVRDHAFSVEAWFRAADVAGRVPVKQCLPGPYSLARRFAPSEAARGDLTRALADALAGELVDLAAAGCPLIQIDEDAVTGIDDDIERGLFAEAQRRLLSGRDATDTDGRPHLSLAIVGGNADRAGAGAIFGPAYDSYLFDLVAGPDSWNLINQAPTERGIVLGLVDPGSAVQDPEVILWAIGYAASTRAHGEPQVGIATSGSLAGMTRVDARRRIDLLGRVVGLVERSRTEPIAASLDPRAIDSRSAALGRWTPSERSSGDDGA